MEQVHHNYRVHFEPEPEGGFTVTVPSLPGCVTWGRDYNEAVEKARECIEGFLEALAKAGEPIPEGEAVEQPVDALIQITLPAPA
jgi:predicted RNase H-like HicB family nuclease